MDDGHWCNCLSLLYKISSKYNVYNYFFLHSHELPHMLKKWQQKLLCSGMCYGKLPP